MTKINNIMGGNYQNSAQSKAKNENKTTNESLFTKLDINKDGKITKQELAQAGYTGKNLNALSEAIFFAERNVNKWFSYDKDMNSKIDAAEDEMWRIHNTDDFHKIGDMTPEKFAKKFNIEQNDGKAGADFEAWCMDWIENTDPMIGIKAKIKQDFGKDMSDEETQLLYDAMKNQVNRWLFKEPALYGRLNSAAYTRLATDDELISCCGGDISKPPMGEQPKLNPDGTLAEAASCTPIFSSLKDEGAYNTSKEMKNKVAWAAFKTVPAAQAAKMSKAEYAAYQQDWQELRNMKAEDFRALLQPENKAKLEKFEENSNMTVKQIVDYIDIVEKTTGKPYDSDDWTISNKDFHDKIMPELNGTAGDDKILEGKTRADITADKQELLNYLESHGLLLDQFK